MNYKLAVALVLVSGMVWACPKNCEERESLCVCSEPAIKYRIATDASVVSDEKPPADKMPSYQREGIVADMPESLAAQDMKLDQERYEAIEQGKKAAGLIK